ncbi:hypothetical protein LCGC14_3007110 [marine sediment metagenome]|uniref:C2H2-type domain-containing protein n=1 Tax=marine sediment metagenome TaxID=412755 RepID=A0A0F8Z6Z2_9ZZZZ
MSTPDSSETTAASSVFVCPMHPEVRQFEPGKCPKCGMHLVPESELELHSAHDHHDHHAGAAPADGRYDLVPTGHDGPIYTCSMHPQVKMAAQGRCPICGMNLIPAKSGSSAHAGRAASAGHGAAMTNKLTVSTSTTADKAAITRQRVCAVAGSRLGSMGTPVKVTMNGQSLFLCCKGCVGKVEKNPAGYFAKAAQLRAGR